MFLTIACSDYDHVRDFASGKVIAQGIDARFVDLGVEEIFHRFLEFRDIAGDDGRIETQIVHAREDRILTELPMNRIQHLRQRVASGLCVALRPEQRDDLVARETAVPCHGKEAEQRQSPPLRRPPRQGTVIRFERDGAQRPQPQHVTSG